MRAIVHSVFAALSFAALAAFATACGGSTNHTGGGAPNPSPTGTGDDNTPPATVVPRLTPLPDHGKVSDTYPAYKPEMGQLVNNGGAVLKAPVIVTITWPADDSVAGLEDFGDQITGTEYWTKITSEYGVGAGSSGATNHVHITTAAPASMSDQQLDQFVAQNAKNASTSGWPAPTDQTIYVVYLHPSTSLLLGGSDACAQGVGGYHMSTAVNGQDVAYAIIPRCGKTGQQGLDEATMAASHEIGEASLDPHPETTPGWVGFDDNHLAFEYFQQFQSENGDACEFYRDSFYKETAPFAYAVQRQWSNASAAAGHNPCVPATSDPYFNVTPLELETVTADLRALGASATQMSKGFHVLVGKTKTFPIGFYSDGPTSGPWEIAVDESNPILGAPQTRHLKLSVDKTSGQNGEKAYVTVEVMTAGRTKAELITVVSTLNGVKHYMPILIGSM